MAVSDDLEQRGRTLAAHAGTKRRLAADLRREADQVAPLLKPVSSQLTPSVWKGPAASRAFAAFTHHRSSLSSSVSQLRDLADQLEAEANRLDQLASDAFDAADRASQRESVAQPASH